MIHAVAKFRIKQGNLDDAKRMIYEFLRAVRKNEPNTLRYESFQIGSDKRLFVHFMSFSDRNAKSKHENSSYVKHFAKKICPICEQDPKITELDVVDSNVVEAEKLISPLRHKNQRL